MYRVTQADRLPTLCLELLDRQEQRALWDTDLDPDTRSRFGLTPAEDDEL